jgi:hypothetical protein
MATHRNQGRAKCEYPGCTAECRVNSTYCRKCEDQATWNFCECGKRIGKDAKSCRSCAVRRVDRRRNGQPTSVAVDAPATIRALKDRKVPWEHLSESQREASSQLARYLVNERVLSEAVSREIYPEAWNYEQEKRR